jgi:predicted enzyme related to lactoylglutathione lyase
MHGFCHIEIPTTDASKSKAFYSGIFGWKMNESNPDYIMFSTPDDEGGGFTTTSKPTTNGVILYIEVENIEKKLREIENAGGTVVKPKTGISEEFGFFALFSDPCGTIMGLWSKKG